MTDKELMQEVLEAMESLHRTGDTQVFDMCAAPVLIPALRERLAQPEQCQYPDCKCATENPCLKGLAQPEQEPVSGVVLDEHGSAALVKNGSEDWHCKNHNAHRLYTAPPQRTWFGLTDEKWKELWEEFNDGLDALEEEFQERMIVNHGDGYYHQDPKQLWEAQQKLIQRLVEAKLKEKNSG